MSRALFVSDIHISSAQDPKFSLFLRFLDSCIQQKITHLFLVGDIFDLWIADRRFFTERYAGIVEKFREVKAAGIELHYFEGNHDLDLSPFWSSKLGFTVYSEAADFLLNGKRVRVEHGDQMDPHDRGYLFLRWLLRTPLLVWMGRYLPDGVVGWIGSRASASSRDYTSQVKVASDDKSLETIRAHARKVFAEKPFDIIVSGHVHVPEDSTQDGFRCINMGTWLKAPYVFDLSEERGLLRPVSDFLELK